MSRAPSAAPKLGMIVLQTDETVEYESRFYLRDADARLLVSRIAVSDEISAASLQAMRGRLRQALALFPEHYPFDVIAYACTSAAAVIGEQTIADDIRRSVRAAQVTNPLTAAVAALRHLKAARIAYLSPYVSEVALAMQEVFKRAGFSIAAADSFNTGSDRAVAAIPPPQIAAAIRRLGGAADADAVFVSCTNLQCAEIIAAAEEQIGKPVISSNQALLWHALRLAGAPPPAAPAFGRLFNS